MLLSTRNLDIPGVAAKFKPRYIGPFRVSAVRGVTATLELPDHLAGIHPVFHVSLLRPYYGPEDTPPEPLQVNGEEQWEVERILDRRILRNKMHYLVQWRGFPAEHNSWEPVDNLAGASQLIEEFDGARTSRAAGARVPRPRVRLLEED